jgi:hypothetical protein
MARFFVVNALDVSDDGSLETEDDEDITEI